MDVLPAYILGAPFLPLLVCTIAAGMVAVGVMGEADNPVTFIGCALIGWVAAILFRGAGHLYHSLGSGFDGGLLITLFAWIGGIVVALVIFALFFEAVDFIRIRRIDRRNYVVAGPVPPLQPRQNQGFYQQQDIQPNINPQVGNVFGNQGNGDQVPRNPNPN